MKLYLLLIGLSCVIAEEELQTTFYLPYSQTEDVDFHIAKDNRDGCFQWYTDNTEVIELKPFYTDYVRQCGYRVQIQILPGTASSSGETVIKVTGENIDEVENEEAKNTEFTIIVTPIAKLEVMALKTKLTAGQDSVPFGVAAFDAKGNEFDTLDGVQIDWYVGANKDIAKFEDRQNGPIVRLKPLKSGKGGVICLLSDPNYEDLEPAVMEFSISAPLVVEPDGVYLLEGGNANIRLFEKVGSKEEPELSPLEVLGDNAEYILDVKEPEIISINKETAIITGVTPEDETTLFVKDMENNIVKGVPIRCVKPARLEVTAIPHPESRQLIVHREYEIVINVFDEDDHKIYPSDNILTKTTFGKQFDIIEISENGLHARVRATMVGIGKIKASLRSTLTPEDDEVEISPHVKGFTDFQIFEELLLTPSQSILPWDETVNPEYKLYYKVTGGGKVYGYKVEPESMASVDSDGMVSVLSGPGTITYTAGMVKSMHNNHTAKVYLLRPTDLEFKEDIAVEGAVGQTIQVPIRALGEHPDTKDSVMFTDCADIPLDIKLSNKDDFQVEGTNKRGEHTEPGSCQTIKLKGLTGGASTKLTVIYPIPGTHRQLRIFNQISTYESLRAVSPVVQGESRTPVVLPVGSSRNIVFKGGPQPWIGKPSSYYKTIIAEEPEVVRVVEMVGENNNYHVYEVTCVKLGNTRIRVTVGNKPCMTNKRPAVQSSFIDVFCSEPAKIQLRLGPTPHVGGSTGVTVANPQTGRVMTYNYRDLHVLVTVKDATGRTMDNVTSLEFTYSVSDDDLLPVREQGRVTQGTVPFSEQPQVELPGKAFKQFSPAGKKGDVDVYVAITGYRQPVLEWAGAATPPTLPSPPPFDEDYDDEDEEEFQQHAHGMAEIIELTLSTDAEIEAVMDKNNKKP